MGEVHHFPGKAAQGSRPTVADDQEARAVRALKVAAMLLAAEIGVAAASVRMGVLNAEMRQTNGWRDSTPEPPAVA